MIEEIIKNKQIDIYFQAIVSIRTKRVYAFEALTRCNFNEQNIPPTLLFSLAKEKGLSVQLDELTRDLAIKKFEKYYKKNKNLLLFLNIESSLINNFNSNEAHNGFIETIIKHKIPFKNFVLEIKEDEIKNMEALKSFCSTYRELGFFIALDDFGTGSSNFHRIDLIRPDIIKIDKSLFTKGTQGIVNKEVVKAISKMSHNLGIRVLAEGVEDEEAISLGLKSFINLFQGYYFAKPKLEHKLEDEEKIIEKISTIGKAFKQKTIEGINKKRQTVLKYDSICSEIIKKIKTTDNTHDLLKKEFANYLEIEAIYLIDSKDSRQVNNTIINEEISKGFRPTSHGEEHYLKEYYYITMESKNGIYLSQKYISYASGNICKTFAKKFSLEEEVFILCFDIVVR